MNILYLKEGQRFDKKKWFVHDQDYGRWYTRILLAERVENASPAFGGATSHERGMVKAFMQLGHTVSVRYYSKMAPFVFATKPDLIYQRQSRFSLAGVLLKFIYRVPFFLECNGSEVWMLKNWGGKKWMLPFVWIVEKLNWHFADQIFCVSQAIRDEIGRGVVNPNGVDVDVFKPKHTKRKRFTVGWVGTYGAWHGVETIVEAARLLGDDVDWYMMGNGKLRPWAEANMNAFFGTIDHDRMPEFLNSCDVLVSAQQLNKDGSDFFGSPTKLFEYMAVGKPILTTPYGQPGKILEDGVNCFMFQDAFELAHKIRLLKDYPARGKELGINARFEALNWTWQHSADRVIDVYLREKK